MRFNIRQANASDLDAVKKIYAEARAFMRENGNDNQWINGYPENCIEGDLKNGVLYICEKTADTDEVSAADAGKALTENAGMSIKAEPAAVFTLICGEDPAYIYIEGSWKNDLPYAAIHRMGVAASSRGNGAAGACVEFSFNKYGNIKVDTHENNIPMRGFLKKRGFSECGTVYMQDKSPRIAFQKTAGLILASASPRRRELMARLGMPFVSETSGVEEIVPADISAADTAEFLSGIKAMDIFNRHAGEQVTVIGSDTVVIENGRIYGKPHSREDAFDMLKALSGKTHEVRTGVTVISGEGGTDEPLKFSFTNAASVEFYDLADEEINAYIETGEPMDKAGAYGIQGQGALLIKAIHGDYYTIMGFPISQINRELKKHGIKGSE